MGSPGKLGESSVSSDRKPERITPAHQDPRPRACFPPAAAKKEEAPGYRTPSEMRRRERRALGSLSIFIVAMESRVTHPKEPVISKGGCRDYGPVTGNAPGALNPESCVSRKVMDSLGGETVA